MFTRFYRVAFTCAFILSETLRQFIQRRVCAWMSLISPMALADGDDLAGMAKNGADGAKSFQTSGITIIQVVGFFVVVGGLLSIKGMKSNPQIKPWMIITAICVGLMALGIPEFIKRGMTQIGLQPVTVS